MPERYLALSDDFEGNIGNTPFDDLRKDVYRDQYARALLERDGVDRYEKLSELFKGVRQDFAYFVGQSEAEDPRQRLTERITSGMQAIERFKRTRTLEAALEELNPEE